jgi:hypothetical protein
VLIDAEINHPPVQTAYEIISPACPLQALKTPNQDTLKANFIDVNSSLINLMINDKKNRSTLFLH